MTMVPFERQPADIVRVPFMDGFIETVLIDNEPHVLLRPTLSGMGLDADSQLKKLKRKSWGSTVVTTVQVPGDTQGRELAAANLDTWAMLLANIDEHRVAESVKPIVVEYQKKSAKALREFWTQGGSINPAATPEQVEDLRIQLDDVQRAHTARARLEAMGAAKQFGLVNPSYIEAMARTELARMNGDEPDIDPLDYTITADEYLTEKGVAPEDLPSARTRLGRTVAALYRARYSKDPQKIRRPIHGVHREVAVYTHRDIDLFDTAWVEVGRHYDLQGSIELGGAA